ncbi:DUF551 domain-containing protein [Klebsiella grimontii]|uniref:DUF551 domain-containing protein n=1 Tax=Klebsiella grimontii TaxID=2058152 RepID=UPI001AE3B2EE|nr:DUF551 domain-containing protein [Klebsiella grimontii]MDG9851145.1 DUF551 domain-containing protein [Klebsiella grimontii]MDG9965402.1 DUF551 domain-containing protein [Klebsiella grimontii]QTP48187.1 DUF551 domain-containing protein [Klebsiella grimontii]
MTSKLTRERLQEIAEDGFLKHGESKELARIALAAMDSEPVAVVEPSDYVTAAQLVGEGPVRKAVHELYEGALRIGDKLYRHAQPAPVVPDDVLEALQKVARIRLDLNDFDGDRRGIADCLGDAEEALIEVVNRRAAMLQGAKNSESRVGIQTAPALDSFKENADARCGNSPVIPDGYVMVPKEPTDEMIAAAMNCDDVLFNIDDSFCVQFGNIYEAMLAAAPHDIPSLNSVQSVVIVPGKWIPVSERMPTKQDGSVLLTWNGQYIGKELFLMGSFQCIKPGIITHWMPLPARPQEVNHD